MLEAWVIPTLEGQPTENLSTLLRKIIHRSGIEACPAQSAILFVDPTPKQIVPLLAGGQVFPFDA